MCGNGDTHLESKKEDFYKTKGAKPNKTPTGAGKIQMKNQLSVRDKKMRFVQKRIIYLRFNKYTKEYLKYHLLN